MAAEQHASRRPVTERALGAALAVATLALALTLLAGWLTVRQPAMEPVPVPSVARA